MLLLGNKKWRNLTKTSIVVFKTFQSSNCIGKLELCPWEWLTPLLCLRVSTGRLKPLKTFKKLKLEARLLSCCLLVSTFVVFLTLRRWLHQDMSWAMVRVKHGSLPTCLASYSFTSTDIILQSSQKDKHLTRAFASVFIGPVNCYISGHVHGY